MCQDDSQHFLSCSTSAFVISVILAVTFGFHGKIWFETRSEPFASSKWKRNTKDCLKWTYWKDLIGTVLSNQFRFKILVFPYGSFTGKHFSLSLWQGWEIARFDQPRLAAWSENCAFDLEKDSMENDIAGTEWIKFISNSFTKPNKQPSSFTTAVLGELLDLETNLDSLNHVKWHTSRVGGARSGCYRNLCRCATIWWHVSRNSQCRFPPCLDAAESAELRKWLGKHVLRKCAYSCITSA